MTTQPHLPGVAAPRTYDRSVARAAIDRARQALNTSRARRRPHPDEAAVIARGRALHLDALERVTSRTDGHA